MWAVVQGGGEQSLRKGTSSSTGRQHPVLWARLLQEAENQPWLRRWSNRGSVHSCYGKLRITVTKTQDLTLGSNQRGVQRCNGQLSTGHSSLTYKDQMRQLLSSDLSDQGMMGMRCRTADYHSAFKASSDTCGDKNKPWEKKLKTSTKEKYPMNWTKEWRSGTQGVECHCVMAIGGGCVSVSDQNVREKGRLPRNVYKILSVEK